MYLVGWAYNFCWEQDSLRGAAQPGERLKGGVRTPAMAAGLTDHRRTVELPDPVAPLGRPQAPGTPAEAISGTQGGPTMITVPWGATQLSHFVPQCLIFGVFGRIRG